MRAATPLIALAALGCSQAPKGPADVGVVEARTLLEVALDARAQVPDPRFRVQLRVDIADAYGKAGVISAGHRELADALKEARALADPNDRGRMLARAAQVYLKLGDRAAALQVLEELRTPDDRAELLASTVTDVPAALAIPTPGDRDRALARLAREAAAAGDPDRAGQAAARIADGSVRAPVMGHICAALLRKGRPIDAKRMAGQLEGLARSEVEAVLALDAAKKDELRAANKWLDGIEDPVVRVRTLAQVGATRANGSGERRRSMAEALKTALDIRSAELRTSAIEALARVLVDGGDALGADTVMGTALAAPVRLEPGTTALSAAGARRVRAVVAQGYAAERDTISAVRIAGAIDDPVLAGDAWAAVARASLKAGLLESALASAARIIPDELRMPVVAEIVVAEGPPPGAELRAALTTALQARPGR